MSDEFRLVGVEYVPVRSRPLSRTAKVLWRDLLPQEVASEARVRASNAASQPGWLDKKLRWQGCDRAVPFADGLWLRCPNAVRSGSLCAMHSKSGGTESPSLPLAVALAAKAALEGAP